MRAAVALCALAVIAAAPAATASAPAAVEPDCAPWSARTVVSGLGKLENLEPDGRGGLLLSASDRRAVLRLLPDGSTSVLAPDVPNPGGMRVRGQHLLVTTGNAAPSAVLGTPDGTIDRVDLRTGERSTWAADLVMPNGLVLLPSGDPVVSRPVNVVNPTWLTRIDAETRRATPGWAAVDGNGLGVSPDGVWLYATETFTLESRVHAVRIADPRDVRVVATLGGAGVPKGLDDMTVADDGALYVAANASGEVLRVDPATGASCAVATGLGNPTAVKAGRGPGWPADRLYVTGFDGQVVELAPPA